MYDTRDSEKLMKDWIDQYIRELKQIDEFYIQKLTEKIKRFIELQAQYI